MFALIPVLPWLRWLGLAVCLLAFFIAMGWLLSGVPQGIFVGKGKTWSLSITQALLWTVILLPAVLTVWLARLGHAGPADVQISNELLLLMGLPIASLTGAAAITAGKARNRRTPVNLDQNQVDYVHKHLDAFWAGYLDSRPETPAGEARQAPPKFPRAVETALNASPEARPESLTDLRKLSHVAARVEAGSMGARPAGPQDPVVTAFMDYLDQYMAKARRGVVVVNLDRKEARPSDMLSGDEVGDADGTDFGKVQYFVVSLLAMVAYIVMLLQFLGRDGLCNGTAECALPAAQGALTGMLLTSTVGYLGLKGAPSTPTN